MLAAGRSDGGCHLPDSPRTSPPERGLRSLLAERDFLRLWSVGALAATARWLEMLAVGIFVFEATGSAPLVAAVLMLRMLPLGLFGIFGGEVASRFDRRAVLLTTLGLSTLIAAALGALAWFERLGVWQVAIGAFLAGLAWVVDFPVRRTLMADVVGSARIGAAMSVDTVASSGTRMVGPLMGGALYAAAGMDGVFLLTACAYALAFVVLLRLPRLSSHGPSAGRVFEKIRDGLRDLKRLPVLQAVLAVTVVFNVWGFPVISMVPVVGAEGLALAPFQIGVLASMEGLGSLLGALLLAALARPGRYRQIYFFGVAVYLVAATLFAHMGAATLTGALLLAMGLSMAAFAAMQSVLVLREAPAESRPRMMGLLSACIGSGPIGLAHIGLMSAWFGAAAACSIVAAEGLLALAIVVAKWPALVRRERET